VWYIIHQAGWRSTSKQVMLSQPVPSLSVSGAKQASHNCMRKKQVMHYYKHPTSKSVLLYFVLWVAQTSNVVENHCLAAIYTVAVVYGSYYLPYTTGQLYPWIQGKECLKPHHSCAAMPREGTRCWCTYYKLLRLWPHCGLFVHSRRAFKPLGFASWFKCPPLMYNPSKPL
jgi:hypothetical protein